MDAPTVTGPTLVNSPVATIQWVSAEAAAYYTVAGAGESTYDGKYLALDESTGVYQHRDRAARFLYFLPSYSTWSLYTAANHEMPGSYWTYGTLLHGPDGVWSPGHAVAPAPTVTRHEGTSSGIFRYQYGASTTPSPEGWSTPAATTAVNLTGLNEGVYHFFVQEQTEDSGWSTTGTWTFTVSFEGAPASFEIPEGYRAVLVDAAGKEYLWGGGVLPTGFAPLLVAAPIVGDALDTQVTDTMDAFVAAAVDVGEPTYIFVTSNDRYHLADCPFAATGIELTAAQILAREGVPCQRCNPPDLGAGAS